jgi:hypothetical protein
VIILTMPPPFELMAVGLWPMVAGSGSREREESTYAAAALGKNRILTGRARRLAMPMANVCNGGCVFWAAVIGRLARGAGEWRALNLSFLREFVVFLV